LRRAGRRIVLIDANSDHCHRAEQQGFQVVFGNGLEERTLARARLEQALMAIGGTANEEANSLFAREARELFDVPGRYVAVNRSTAGVTASLLARQGSKMLFDRPKDLDRWATWSRRDQVRVERFRFAPPAAPDAAASGADSWAILAIERRGDVVPMHSDLTPAAEDAGWIAIYAPEAASNYAALATQGWQRDRADVQA
jgi:hypothetical protein